MRSVPVWVEATTLERWQKRFDIFPGHGAEREVAVVHMVLLGQNSLRLLVFNLKRLLFDLGDMIVYIRSLQLVFFDKGGKRCVHSCNIVLVHRFGSGVDDPSADFMS